MGLLSMLMGNSFGDLELASDMLKDSKFEVIALSKAFTEITNPELRDLLGSQLLTAIAQHHKLSDLTAGKDWYKPYLAPQDQVTNDLKMAGSVTSQ